MKIMMISANYPPVLNGYANQCKDTTEAFEKLGHEVCVVTSNNGLHHSEMNGSVHKVLKSLPLEGYKSFSPRYILRQIRRWRIYRKNSSLTLQMAQAFKPQVMMVWQFDSIGFGIIQVAQKMGIPSVFNVEDYSLHAIMSGLKGDPHKFWRMCRRLLYRVDLKQVNVSRLIMASEELKDFYKKEGFPEKNMTVVHNAIDSRHIALKPSKAGSGKKLLYVGRIHPTKGVELAIRSLAILNGNTESPFTFDIFGAGDIAYVRRLKDLGKKLNLGTSLRFVGPKDRNALLKLYQKYDLLLFPSVWQEPFGLTVIEAMARGLPVVAINRGGPKNIISHMVDGILVESDQPEEFASYVSLIASNRELRKSIAESAIKTIRERFNLDKHVTLTEKLLQDAIIQKRNSMV